MRFSWVMERDSGCMERDGVWLEFLLTSVELISHNRPAPFSALYAKLVHSAGLRPEFQAHKPAGIETGTELEPSSGVLRARGAWPAALNASQPGILSHQPVFPEARVWNILPIHHGPVFLGDRAFFKLA